MLLPVDFVAHRGQPLRYPENSLEGYRHVLAAGARYVETDINFTADEIPVLSHDADLLRLSGQNIVVAEHHFCTIKAIPAGYPDRFGDRFNDCRIASLVQFSALLKQWPAVTCFIELKEESLLPMGHRVVDLSCDALADIAEQAVLISFNYDALVYAKQAYDFPVGWVLPGWTEENHTKAIELAPEYLFVDTDFCPTDKSLIWPGHWQWAVYTVNQAQSVKQYVELGMALIETDRYSELVNEAD